MAAVTRAPEALGSWRNGKAALTAVGATYALQGFGYGVVSTSLPSFQLRLSLDATTIAVILLGVCVASAAGSVVADLIAVRANSRRAVRIGFGIQAVATAALAIAPSMPAFVVAAAVYGTGLGMVDAASSMQGVLVQRRLGRLILGRCFAFYTSGAIIGGLSMSFVLSVSGVAAALAGAAVVHASFCVFGVRFLDPGRAAQARPKDRGGKRDRLPRASVMAAGVVVLAAFTIDSGISTWSTVHLADLGLAAALAPLGYIAYQVGVLVARLATDMLIRRFGFGVLLTGASMSGVAGGLVVVLVPGPVPAVLGFTVSGLAVGVLVPVAFDAAGRILPERSDEVIARVNLFNYIGAVLGSVGVGVLIDAAGAPAAFQLPVVVLVIAWVVTRRVPVHHG
ncbi:MFS transporter [Streptomyces sp. NPDC056527]|uniref:MFS transporter n=1 Tax=Streptomyces sp. NPDC056527 TaxID=3345853 RepID=UPI0036BD6AE7